MAAHPLSSLPALVFSDLCGKQLVTCGVPQAGLARQQAQAYQRPAAPETARAAQMPQLEVMGPGIPANARARAVTHLGRPNLRPAVDSFRPSLPPCKGQGCRQVGWPCRSGIISCRRTIWFSNGGQSLTVEAL